MTLQEAEDADFRFWPTFRDNTEPDLVLQVGRYYVLIEAKLHSGYGTDDEDQERHQLLREAHAGRDEALRSASDFILLTVTDEPVARECVYGVLKGAARVSWRWTNWSNIAHLLETGPPIGHMGQDLLALLWRKGLRRFDGFTGEQERLDGLEGYGFFGGSTANVGGFTGFADLLGARLATELTRPLFTVADATAGPRPKRKLDSDERAK